MTKDVDVSMDNLSQEPGSRLAQGRQAAGLSVEQAAQRLHLSPRQVVALENNEYEHLPEPTYVKGYIRNYAQLLNMDPDPLVESYNRRIEEARPVDVVQPAESREITSDDRVVKLATAVVVLIVISLTVLWWQSERGQGPAEEPPALSRLDTTPETQPGAPASEEELPPPASEPVAGPEAEKLGPEEAVAPAGERAAGEDGDGREPVEAVPETDRRVTMARPEAGQEPAAAPVPPAAAVPEGGGAAKRAQIVLYVEQDSWADIRDHKDNKLLYETLKGGRVVTLEGVPPFSVFLGNVDGVKIYYQGKEFDAGRYKRGLVARFRLGQQGSD